ncbi:hypothetical protein CHH79_00105 [Bacillus siamensis]|nr:hypothetical protein CHH79_00105 [Bacillus siamensis]
MVFRFFKTNEFRTIGSFRFGGKKRKPLLRYIEWLSGEFFWIGERGFLLYKYVFFFLSFISCRRNR